MNANQITPQLVIPCQLPIRAAWACFSIWTPTTSATAADACPMPTMAQSAGNHRCLVSLLFNYLDLVLLHHGVIVILRQAWTVYCKLEFTSYIASIWLIFFTSGLNAVLSKTIAMPSPRQPYPERWPHSRFPHFNSRRPHLKMTPLPPSTPSNSPGLQHDGSVRRPALHGYELGWENPWVGSLS